jgi:hypothetical protein
MRPLLRLPCSLLALAPLLAACSSESAPPSTEAPHCQVEGTVFEPGDPVGHPDPLGAPAAKQARAGKITDLTRVPQPAHGRQQIEAGDYLLMNDTLAVVIEDKGLSDGYGRFGGEILAIDKVGADGKPLGLSRYNETLMAIGNRMVKPTSVGVLKDGSDGGEAVIRVTGPLAPIPFLDGPLAVLFGRQYDLQMAYDYVLTPGSETLGVRIGLINPGADPIDFFSDGTSSEAYGFFQYSRSQLVTPARGFAKAGATTPWVGFDGGPLGFAVRTKGNDLYYGIDQSGFQLFWGAGFKAEACARTQVDRLEIIAGGPEYDGLAQAVRHASGEAPWREIQGKLSDAQGEPVEGAWIHGLGEKGAYLTRTRSGADGAFTLHAPPGAPITLVPQKQGYPVHAGTVIEAASDKASLQLAPEARLKITATDAEKKSKIPVRIQVIPTVPPPETPESYGVLDEVNGRLYQEFAVTGEATLIVPPGEHRVIVTRGYEWELLDTTVTVGAGETREIPAPLVHSVPGSEVMCADFHIHSFFSADSNDPVEHKVKGAVADGLEIPVSSEHEWVVDFQPILQKLGLTPWAYGVPSSELTTFAWGHFGVVPLTPRDGVYNHGAVDWIGKSPGETFSHVHALPEAPVLIVNHPRGSGIGAYFSAATYDRKTDTGDPALWSSEFDAIEVFNDSDFEHNRKDSVADWFALLNHGHQVGAVGSSDSHHLRTSPVGYPRTCLYFGHDDPTKLSAEAVRDAVASGNSTISGGLLMSVTGPGGERPGQTVSAKGGSAVFLVTVDAPSWIGADTLETIVNGETVKVEPLLPLGEGVGKHFVNQVEVSLDPQAKRSWVVFHAKGESDLAPLHPGRRPFAVSNPIMLKMP